MPELILRLLGGSDAQHAAWEAKVLNKFFAQNGDRGMVTQESDAWAWVCDRKIAAGRSRDYGRSFDPDGLRGILDMEVIFSIRYKSNMADEQSGLMTRSLKTWISV
jgi:hypothetical protein